MNQNDITLFATTLTEFYQKTLELNGYDSYKAKKMNFMLMNIGALPKQDYPTSSNS